ncbi:hypothetical protein [Mucilaginibacter psychrotolerans]|uniref:Uncharacterized protein n=1 Tax=Mucilaginibacter psychrotolerans TaxID=1524096 RepID=A0A4Y8SHU4_9SPHI|nr:hypothetical protein [Mucilaginibacter psychrotolerans]TFF38508.1 hypothetical protein E2R66_08555 [Mucilaginibacter psychrotolerans]
MEKGVIIFADFNNADMQGRVRLNTRGTFEDIKTFNIDLRPGLNVVLDDKDELTIEGVLEFSEEENIWVAKINWNEFNKPT